MQDCIGQTKGSDHILKEQVCNLLCVELSLPHKARHKANMTKDTLNASHHSIGIITQGQAGHEVNGPIPNLLQVISRVQQTSRCLGAILGMLADLACTHNPSTVPTHTWPPNTL